MLRHVRTIANENRLVTRARNQSPAFSRRSWLMKRTVRVRDNIQRSGTKPGHRASTWHTSFYVGAGHFTTFGAARRRFSLSLSLSLFFSLWKKALRVVEEASSLFVSLSLSLCSCFRREASAALVSSSLLRCDSDLPSDFYRTTSFVKLASDTASVGVRAHAIVVARFAGGVLARG